MKRLERVGSLAIAEADFQIFADHYGHRDAFRRPWVSSETPVACRLVLCNQSVGRKAKEEPGSARAEFEAESCTKAREPRSALAELRS